MNKEYLDKLLKHITIQFNKVLGRSKFLRCWENTDRKWECDDDKIEYLISSDVDELTHVYLHFLYDPHTDVLQLIRSGRNVRDYIMWESSDASKFTKKSDFSELCETFRTQMSFWFDCLIHIKMIDDKAREDKRYWLNSMNNIAEDIFKYDV